MVTARQTNKGQADTNTTDISLSGGVDVIDSTGILMTQEQTEPRASQIFIPEMDMPAF